MSGNWSNHKSFHHKLSKKNLPQMQRQFQHPLQQEQPRHVCQEVVVVDLPKGKEDRLKSLCNNLKLSKDLKRNRTNRRKLLISLGILITHHSLRNGILVVG